MPDEFETFRDQFLSLYQSAVSDVARRIDAARGPADFRARGPQHDGIGAVQAYAADIARREYARKHAGTIPPTPSHPLGRALRPSEAVRNCAELAFRYMQARLSNDISSLGKIQGEFKASVCDPAWASTIEEYMLYFGSNGKRKEIPYVRAVDIGERTIEIKANSTIALVGDWGTGAQPAVEILEQIGSFNPDVLIHLGDIYYSGTPLECEVNFKSLIESVLRKKNPDLAVYSLAGNHDMYCGGVGYYQLVQALNQKLQAQLASFFCLRSIDKKWQILAMDTGLHDYSPLDVDEVVTYIEDDELEWHCSRVREFAGRTILLSHHQLFSAFSPIGKCDPSGRRSAMNPHLLAAFEKMRVIAPDRIAAWYWGHEHTLSIYNPFAGFKKAAVSATGQYLYRRSTKSMHLCRGSRTTDYHSGYRTQVTGKCLRSRLRHTQV